MSKQKKRSISELLKSRPKGRFAKEGFDLLGEGDRIKSQFGKCLVEDVVSSTPPLPCSVEEHKQDVGGVESESSGAIAKSGVANCAVASVAVDSLAIAGSEVKLGAIAEKSVANFGIANFEIDESVVAEKDIAIDAIVDSGLAEEGIASLATENSAIENKGIVSKAIKDASIAKPTIVSSSAAKKALPKATRKYFEEAYEELERLRRDSVKRISIDTYIIDSLFSRLNNPSYSLIYLYIWRRSIGEGSQKADLSLRVISEAIGVSKRCVQEGVKHLNEIGLIKTIKKGKTAVPCHKVMEPWKKLS